MVLVNDGKLDFRGLLWTSYLVLNIDEHVCSFRWLRNFKYVPLVHSATSVRSLID